MSKNSLTLNTSHRTPFAPLQCRVLEPNIKSCSRLTKAYFHSPLETETIRHQRAKEFGLSPHPTDSFLHNQSFPGLHTDPENGNQCFDMGNVHRYSLDKFRGDDINSINFGTPKYLQHDSDAFKNKHFDGSWMLYKYILNSSVSLKKNLHSFLYNPNKAVLTIDARSTQILTANHRAFSLLGLDENVSAKLKDFLLSSDDQYLFTEADLKPNGEIVLFSGKVMNLVTNFKETVPVSVWARQISTASEFRCLVIMENVEQLTGTVKFDLQGTIIDCDTNFANLYGYETSDPVLSLNIKEFIPSLELEWENQQKTIVSENGLKMCTTGSTKDKFSFPLNINVKPCASIDESLCANSDNQLKSGSATYEGTVSVFSTISGMITILPNGSIHSCNTNFSMMLFGYSQSELVGKDVSVLIPTFYDDIEYLDTNSVALPPFDDDDDSNAKCCNSDGRTTADSFAPDLPRPMNPLGRPLIDEEIDLAISPQSRNSLSSNHSINGEDLQDSDNIKLPMHSSNLSSDHLLNVDETSDKNLKPFSSHSISVDCTNCDVLKNEEQSTSSHGNSSRQMSCSESQDTIHSSTNSFAESDINANVLEFSECKDRPDCSIVLTKAVCSDNEEDSFESESDDSKSEESENESESYDSEEDVCSESEFKKNISVGNKTLHSPFPCDCKYENSNALEKHTSDCVNSRAFNIKVSTPVHNSQNSKSSHDLSNQSIPDGVYIGIGRHKEGTELAIEYCVKKVHLDTGKFLYCIWVSRDPEEIKEGMKKSANKTESNHNESSKTSLSGTEESESVTNSSVLLEEEYIAGPFSEHYTILQHLGKGAFGCIKKAYRNIDGLLVIAKFIRKSEVYKDAWVFDNKLNKKVPLEISLLTIIEHPNIVKVIDVFENDQCFHMIMEKHGSGMDLFEFIERNPIMDEALASYIFRQMVSAVSYLHSLNILHRDIKDENAIIDEKFHVKLIDFGSAAFMGDDLFSVFCGTTEYCSPEVLKGEKYRGPELEMFSMGVTLYTLVLGQNPFVGADEILKGEYSVDREISESLSELLKHLLEPDPKKRCTLQELENHPWINQPILITDYKFSEVVTASEDELHPIQYISFTDSENDYDESHSIDSDLSHLMKGASIKLNHSNSLSESGDSFS